MSQINKIQLINFAFLFKFQLKSPGYHQQTHFGKKNSNCPSLVTGVARTWNEWHRRWMLLVSNSSCSWESPRTWLVVFLLKTDTILGRNTTINLVDGYDPFKFWFVYLKDSLNLDGKAARGLYKSYCYCTIRLRVV